MSEKESESNKKTPKPHFRWGKYGRGVLLLFIDTILLFLISGFIYLFVRYIILQTSVDIHIFNGEDWANMVGNVAWPLALLLALFLFRNPLLLLLYETQGFIFRSYYRQGENDEDVKKRGDDAIPIDELKTKNEKNPARQSEIEVESAIFSSFKLQYGTPVLREMCISDSRYYFDGVIKVNNSILGIEVKKTVEAKAWEKVFNRVQSLFAKLDEGLKSRFVFVACIVGENPVKERSGIEHLALNQDFRIVLRFYEESANKTLKEVL